MIFSKSRIVHEKKNRRMPRLELPAVLIGTRCLKFVEKHLGVSVTEKYLWTDSQCVLHWIHSKKTLTTFVENQLKEIKTHKDVEEFSYVSTAENSADIGSRGMMFIRRNTNQ